jgi:putative membrane protein
MLRILIALPILLLLVLFALSNPEAATFHLWPTDFAVALPLSLAVLGAMAVAFVLGALVVWFSLLAARRRARRAEYAARLLEAQVAELKARLAPVADTRALATVP